MAQYFDRYNKFRIDAEIKPIPGLTIQQESSDKFTVYKQSTSRLDKISNSYYNNPYSGWLIMLANPELGGLEFNIPDSTIIRIPFPYDSAVSRYITQITLHKQLYGE
jgi:hypothetical protein